MVKFILCRTYSEAGETYKKLFLDPTKKAMYIETTGNFELPFAVYYRDR